jgi:hypothetical protein
MTHLDCRPNSRPERTHQIPEKFRALALGISVFWIQGPVDKVDRLSFFSKLVNGLQWCLARVAISPDLHQRGIDGNSSQPSCELGPSVEIP